MVTVKIGTREHKIPHVGSLNRIISNKISPLNNAEIWITGHGDSRFCVLLNPDAAFLTFLKHEEDFGHSSRSSGIDSVEYKKFLMSNGDESEFPSNYLVKRATALDAIRYYFKNGTMYPKVEWEYDG